MKRVLLFIACFAIALAPDLAFAVSFVAQGTPAASSGSNCVAAVPAGTTNGNEMLMLLSDTCQSSCPSGWSIPLSFQEGAPLSSPVQWSTMCARAASSEPSSYTVPMCSASNGQCGILTYTQSYPEGGARGGTNGGGATSLTGGGVTTVANSAIVMSWVGWSASGGATATGPSSPWTARQNSPAVGSASGLISVDQAIASSGTSSGLPAYNFSGTSNAVVMTLELDPTVTPTPTATPTFNTTTPTPTPTPAPTPTFLVPTPTPTATPTATPTFAVPTATPTPIPCGAPGPYPTCPTGSTTSCTLTVQVGACPTAIFAKNSQRQYLFLQNLGYDNSIFPNLLETVIWCSIGSNGNASSSQGTINTFILQPGGVYEPPQIVKPQNAFTVPSGDISCRAPNGTAWLAAEQE